MPLVVIRYFKINQFLHDALSCVSSVTIFTVKLIVAPCIFCRITSIYQSTNAHIISHKTLLKHFKTLRHVSILSDHHQGAVFIAKVILQYSQFKWYLQTGVVAAYHVV